MSTKQNRNGKRSTLLTALFTVTAFWAASGSQAEAQSTAGTLDMAGDWTFSSGFSPGLNTVNGYWSPLGLATVYQVHFDLEGPTEHGMRYIGYYMNVGGPFGQPGALVAETFYYGQGVQVVQILESPPGLNYFRVLSGKHQLYGSFDPERIEVVGGWSESLGGNGNFTLVRYPD